VFKDRAFDKSGGNQLIFPEKVKARAGQAVEPHNRSVGDVSCPGVEVRGRNRGKCRRVFEAAADQLRNGFEERFEWN
jgi:hypothetical protein